jgi:hypothetical protein
MPDLVDASLDLLIDGEGGIWHLTNGGSATPAGLVRRAAALAGLPHDRVIDVRSPDSEMRGARPVYSVLDSERGRLLPDLDDALVRYLQAWDIRTSRLQVPEVQTSEVQASHLHTFNQPGTAPCPSGLGAAGIARAETLSGSAGQPADLTETGAAAAAQ